MKDGKDFEINEYNIKSKITLVSSNQGKKVDHF